MSGCCICNFKPFHETNESYLAYLPMGQLVLSASIDQLISEISHVYVSLKLADQWPLDGPGSKGWKIESALWRQACNTHERGQTALSSGICCSCQDTADSKCSKQILQAWNDIETGKLH